MHVHMHVLDVCRTTLGCAGDVCLHPCWVIATKRSRRVHPCGLANSALHHALTTASPHAPLRRLRLRPVTRPASPASPWYMVIYPLPCTLAALAQAVSAAGSSPELVMTTFLDGVPLGEPTCRRRARSARANRQRWLRGAGGRCEGRESPSPRRTPRPGPPGLRQARTGLVSGAAQRMQCRAGQLGGCTRTDGAETSYIMMYLREAAAAGSA